MKKPLELKLERTRLNSLNFQFKAKPGQANLPEKGSLVANVGWKSKYDKTQKQLHVILFASVNQDDVPFSLNAAYEGMFHLSKSPKKQELQRLQNVNCPAILFPFLRESIAEVTRRGDLEPVYLPVLNFVQMWHKKRAAEEQGEKGENKDSCSELGKKE